MSVAVLPTRSLTGSELDAFQRDGVIMVSGLIDQNWLELLECGLEEARADHSGYGRFMSRKETGFSMDIFMWKRSDALRDFIYYSPMARWAQQLMHSKEVRFFYDQMFVKEPGTQTPTPWHQDLPFWPVNGNQICSFWIPLDPVTRENSGLQYVKGSHLWNRRFKPVAPDYNPAVLLSPLDDIPDINANPDEYDLACWDMQPGDALLFHPLTVHGSSGNVSRTQTRRAIAFRWTGDDVVFDATLGPMPIAYRHASKPGGPLRGAAFPRILPSHIASERTSRAVGPETMVRFQILKTMARRLRLGISVKLSGKSVKSIRQTW